MARNYPDLHPGASIHESAYVDEPCKIGAGTHIWHFSHVMRDCAIGEHCNLGQNVVVSPGVTIGSHVKVQNNVSIYSGVLLEDYVFCGPSVVFTNVLTPRSEVPRRDQYAPTRVRRGASLGANATIVCGITIGAYALVGAGAVVTQDVPDYALVLGVPARATGWACRCGVVLKDVAGAGDLHCRACGNEYRRESESLKPLREQQGDATSSHVAM